MPDDLKIVEGGFYRTRGGRVVGPMVLDRDLWRNGPNFVRHTGDYWHMNGSRHGFIDSDLDLVESVNPAQTKKEI